MRRQPWAIPVVLVASSLLAGQSAVSRGVLEKRPATFSYSRLPLAFEYNPGQMADGEFFTARGIGYRMLLAPDQISLSLHGRASAQQAFRDDTITIAFEGRSSKCQIHGVDELSGKANYFIGSDPSKWRTGVRTFDRVEYDNVYPGIDLVFYGTGRELEYDLMVHAGADPNQIKLAIKGDSSASIEQDGALKLLTPQGAVRFLAPRIYQEIEGTKKNISGGFRLGARAAGREEVTFALEAYDRSRALVIDPILDYSTYLGGSANDWAGAVAVDNAGNAYLTGVTASLDFPVTPNAVFPVHGGCTGNCYDAFVAKINTRGNGLEYATYLGGSGDDFGTAIALDTSGNAYVTGATNSTDFPTTSKALQRSCGGTCLNNDAFVVKLNATGSALTYSTYLGGSGEDFGSGIAVTNGNAYISGFSGSTDFPVTAGSFQTSMQGQGSSFVVQLNSDASAENFGTFLGEVDLFDGGGAISVDTAGNSYVAGTTLSANFPVTAGAFHTAFLSGLTSNLYVLKLDATGKSLLYSALIGGAGAGGIAVDASGNAYVAASASPLAPVTSGAIDQSCSAGVSLFRFNPSGSNLLTAAHLCPDRLWPICVAADASQNIVFGAYTDSPDLPTTVGSLHPSKTNACCFSDIVLGRVTGDGSALTYLTYFRGNNSDNPNGMVQDSSGNIFLAGSTSSTNFPVKNGVQTADAGALDAFVAEFTLPKVKLSISPAVLNFPARGVGIASPTMAVTIANVTSGSIAISSILASGDFAVSSDGCGLSLATGTHCVVAVGFNPRLSGKRTGVLTVTDGPGVQKVGLSGTGVSGPVVIFSPGYEINTASGVTSPPFPVTITNAGNKNLTITQISLTNGPAFNFAGSTNCFTPIVPLGSCTVDVTFNGLYGQGYGTLSFTDNASGSPQAFGLVGNIVGNGLAFTSVGLRFGQQTVGTVSAAQSVVLINGSGSDVSISNIKTTGNFAQTHDCKAILKAGGYCNIKVTFKATAAGIRQGGISVTDNALGSPQVLPLLERATEQYM